MARVQGRKAVKPLKGSKGANMIIPLVVTAIFIATFFIVFTYDLLLYGNLGCLIHERGMCTKEMFAGLTAGLFIIFFLVIMIAAAVYVMFINLEDERKYRYGKGTKPG